MSTTGLGPGAEVAFVRGGHRWIGTVERVGQRVVDVEVPIQVSDAGVSEVVTLPLRVRLADTSLRLLDEGHEIPLAPDGDPLPLCGHCPVQTGCGGCDAGAIEYVRDDGEQGWLRAS